MIKRTSTPLLLLLSLVAALLAASLIGGCRSESANAGSVELSPAQFLRLQARVTVLEQRLTKTETNLRILFRYAREDAGAINHNAAAIDQHRDLIVRSQSELSAVHDWLRRCLSQAAYQEGAPDLLFYVVPTGCTAPPG